MEQRHWLIFVGLGTAGCGLALTLSWFDVLPGGWTLRGWVKPHVERDAEKRKQHSLDRQQLFLAENQTVQPGAVLFAGASHIERMPLSEWFAAGSFINRGIHSETSADLLARLLLSLPPVPIRGAILSIGANDVIQLQSPPAEIETRAQAILDLLRKRTSTPQQTIPILLIGILPQQDMDAADVAYLAETNAQLAILCERNGIEFLNTDRAPLRTEAGRLNSDYAEDPWHLNQRGYGVLRGWLLEDFAHWSEFLTPAKR